MNTKTITEIKAELFDLTREMQIAQAAAAAQLSPLQKQYAALTAELERLQVLEIPTARTATDE